MAQHPQPPQQPQGILSFLGCKISLVSKSEIRYEGTLYTIDSKQGTVALEKGLPPSLSHSPPFF